MNRSYGEIDRQRERERRDGSTTLDKSILRVLLIAAVMLTSATMPLLNPLTSTTHQSQVAPMIRSSAPVPPGTELNKTYGGTDRDCALSVQRTSDGGYILAGYTASLGAGGLDFWLVKTDSSGNHQWNKTYGGTGTEDAYSVQQTSDGGYIVAGETASLGAGGLDFWLVKTDSSGNHQWNKTYGGTGTEHASWVQQTSDDGYILLGDTDSFGGGFTDMWLVRTDSAGNHQWNKTYGGSQSDFAYCLQQTSDGGYILSGTTSSSGAGGLDFWLVKTDSAGNHQWNKTYGGAGYEQAISVQQTSDDGYIAAGGTYSFGHGGGYDDFWLVKTDSAGNHQWNKTYGYGGTSQDTAESVRQTSDGGYIAAGRRGPFFGFCDAWLVKTDSSGNHQWNKTMGGANDDAAYSVLQTSDGGYVTAGYTASFGAGDEDFWLVKLAGSNVGGGPGPEIPLIIIAGGVVAVGVVALVAFVLMRSRKKAG